jgi:hypothetical protein
MCRGADWYKVTYTSDAATASILIANVDTETEVVACRWKYGAEVS